ncbi:MAG: agmatinase [Candidatus Omnitrophota bacterium]
MEENACFAGLESSFAGRDNSAIVVLPVPYDATSTWIKGSDKGPFAIINASSALEWYDIETDFEVYRKGIHTCSPLKLDACPEKMILQVEKEIINLLKEEKFIVMLGGEHSITCGAVKAYYAKHNDMCVLQLDAHLDTRPEYEGSRFNHACVMARIKEICPVVQAGIRSMSYEEKENLDTKNVFFAKDIVRGQDWIPEVIKQLSPKVYVTIDVDVFDPSVMPSTGTPEPGGFMWYQIMDLLKTLAESRKIIGFDVVELCPNKNNHAPDFIAAKLVYKFLSYIYKQH